MKGILGLLFILILGIFPAKAQYTSIDHLLSKYNKEDVPYISVEELKMLKNKDSVIIADAREQDEFKVSHLKNAECVGYSNFSVEQFSRKFKDKSAPIVVYCSVGIRSEDVSEKLKKAGFSNVHNLYGGIFAWKNNGYQVFTSEDKETDKVHTFSKHWAKYLKNGHAVY